jgi:hypothetical protein
MTTKHVVTDEQLGQLARRQADLFRRVREGTLSVQGVMSDLQRIIEGGSTMVDCDAVPFIPLGLEIRPEDQLPGHVHGQVDATKLGLYLSEEQKNGSAIQGHDLRKELEGKPVLPANVLDHLLKHPRLIPEEWKSKDVFFWGTVYRSRRGHLCVRYLYRSGAVCYQGYDWLHNDWCDHNPAVVLAS